MNRALRCLAILAAAVGGSVMPSTADAQPVPLQRVHGSSKMAMNLLRQGMDRSATIRRLVAELEQSDLEVRVGVKPVFGHAAQTTLAGAASSSRSLEIVVDLFLDPARQLELLGHELRHATEIASARDVHDEAGLRALLQVIGWQTSNRNTFETEAARQTEIRVRHDLCRR